MAACRSCGAEIFWGVNEKGKREPINLLQRSNGNIEITASGETEDGESVIRIRHLKKGEGDTLPGLPVPPRYTSHFSDCPNAASHRKGS